MKMPFILPSPLMSQPFFEIYRDAAHSRAGKGGSDSQSLSRFCVVKSFKSLPLGRFLLELAVL